MLKNSIYYTFSDFFRPKEEIMNGRICQIINAIKKVKNPDHYNLTPERLENFDSGYKKYLEYSKIPVSDLKKVARARRQRARLLANVLKLYRNKLIRSWRQSMPPDILFTGNTTKQAEENASMLKSKNRFG